MLIPDFAPMLIPNFALLVEKYKPTLSVYVLF